MSGGVWVAPALLLGAVAAGPYLVPAERISPISGVLLWLAALLLRAAVAISLVFAFVFLAPATELFSLLTQWCLHTILPFLTSHLGFSGHSVGEVAVIVPAVIVGASLLSLGIGIWRGARRVRGWLDSSSLGPGPRSSVLVGGSEVVVAAAGMRAPEVVVSAGALLSLDDAELEAGLEHEWGHVVRRHRFISVTGHLCLAVSRFLPGGAQALAQLHFHLERDADDYAVQRTGDPMALASAICKAAGATCGPATPGASFIAGLGSDAVAARLRRLTKPQAPGGPALNGLSRTLAGALAVGALAVASSAPAMASSDLHRRAEAQPGHVSNC
jgi:Zn-dependent protease with chaperone function